MMPFFFFLSYLWSFPHSGFEGRKYISGLADEQLRPLRYDVIDKITSKADSIAWRNTCHLYLPDSIIRSSPKENEEERDPKER